MKKQTKTKTKLSVRTVVLASVAVIGIGGLAYVVAPRIATPNCVGYGGQPRDTIKPITDKQGRVLSTPTNTSVQKCCKFLTEKLVSTSSLRAPGSIGTADMVKLCLPTLPGDLYLDGKIDSRDEKVLSNFLNTVTSAVNRADVNGDRVLNQADLDFIRAKMGKQKLPVTNPGIIKAL